MTPTSGDIRHELREAIHHFEHVLPGQAPIQDFVHHNTLHGFQHLPFPRAVAEAQRLTGAAGYLPPERFRELFRTGRITRDELAAALDATPDLDAPEALGETAQVNLTRRDVYLAALLHPLGPITGSQLNWQIDELGALCRFQPDVAPASRERLLAAARAEGRDREAAAVEDLWNAALECLGLEHFLFHPEELLDLSPEQAERMLARLGPEDEAAGDGPPLSQQRMRREAIEQLHALLDRVGRDLTLRGLLKALTGKDVLEQLRPYLIRHLGNFLDQGVAAWHHPDRPEGFYTAWRLSARKNLTWVFEDLTDWLYHLEALPADPLEAVIEELKRLGLPRGRWVGYLERLALELPGWSGMFLWRHLHPGYEGQTHPVGMMDYLAVRLAMERMFAHRLCAEQWRIEPSLDMLRWHFRHHPSEFMVRHALFNERLPEYLESRAQRLVQIPEESAAVDADERWRDLARLVWTWKQSPGSDRPQGHSVSRSAWPLFRLAQHLGLSGGELRALGRPGVETLFECLERLDPDTTGFVWLRAYETHYRDRIFNALVQNHGRGRWADRPARPAAQVLFCMDDREEGIRRHLEEHNPRVETLGAAAHFGVPNWWRGLDDGKPRGLCPVVIVPSHEVRESAQPGQEALAARHRERRGWRVRLRDLLHQEVRRNLASSTALIAAAAPLAAVDLAAKVLAPERVGPLAEGLRRRFEPEVPTRIAVTATEPRLEPSPENVQQGFTLEEQATRVGNFLRAIGLTHGFAPLVVFMGHGSDSQNNPHLSAYNCGACSGNHSGPNARIFADMANRAEVRDLLRERGIDIPDDCRFLGAEHNTCDETIQWYDLDQVPAALAPALADLRRDLEVARVGSAHERARKFASAPRLPSRKAALRHIVGRGHDFSQARPELGHATNACALIGRRSATQGAFFDRRMFLISYDPTRDPGGLILEQLLLANGPVGAGINLEYYFSTVDNQRYGCGSKITHNVTGFLGVLDGAGSDLRTGLPKQMIEIHEAMRLQVIVEAKTEILTAIYLRQPPLQELVGNGWLLLSALDPDDGAIQVFEPERGWVPWTGPATPLPTAARSADYYPGTLEPLDPVLIAQEEPTRA